MNYHSRRIYERLFVRLSNEYGESDCNFNYLESSNRMLINMINFYLRVLGCVTFSESEKRIILNKMND